MNFTKKHQTQNRRLGMKPIILKTSSVMAATPMITRMNNFQNSTALTKALAEHAGNLFLEVLKMHTRYSSQHVYSLSCGCSREKGLSDCCQSEGSTPEMLVHFSFDRIISSIIVNECSLAMW